MPSFGDTLKRERELRQISLREIAEATKINLRYLEALERNDFRHLPGGVFNKGFVRAYAEFIGADAEGMVNAYLLEDQLQRERLEEPGPAEARGAGAREVVEEAPGPPLGRLALLAVAALVLIAAVALVTWKGFFAKSAWFRGEYPSEVTSRTAPLVAAEHVQPSRSERPVRKRP